MIEQLRAAAAHLPIQWCDAAPGRQLRLLREAMDVSQRHLAERTGVDQADISRIESGADVRVSTLSRLFEGLGWSLALCPARECDETTGLLEDGHNERWERQHSKLRSWRL